MNEFKDLVDFIINDLKLKGDQCFFFVGYDGKSDIALMTPSKEKILGNCIWNMMNEPTRRRVLTSGVLSWLREKGLIDLSGMLYFLVEDGYNPETNTVWYNFIEAKNQEDAEKIATNHKLDPSTVEPIHGQNLMEAIGYAMAIMSYPQYSLKPLVTCDDERDIETIKQKIYK